MPVTDAIEYLHGSGSTAYGPITSTVNAFTAAIATTGVMTVSAVATGQLAVGQLVVGQVIPTYILSLGTGTGGTGTYNVTAPATAVSSGALTSTPNTQGDIFLQAGSQYTNLELDFGAPNTGGSFPFIAQFPSLTEKTYTFPAEVVGQGGVEMGLHLIVTAAFNTLTSVAFSAVTSATTNALIGGAGNPIGSRTFSLAQLQVVGAHYWIGCPASAILEFLRGYGAITGSNPTAGTIVVWFGPRTGGEQ